MRAGLARAGRAAACPAPPGLGSRLAEEPPAVGGPVRGGGVKTGLSYIQQQIHTRTLR